MFTAFMNDAANLMSFYEDMDIDGSVGYAIELWVFKPKKSGQQVSVFKSFYDKLLMFHSLQRLLLRLVKHSLKANKTFFSIFWK